MTEIGELRIKNTDICLSSVIYKLHRDKTDMYISKILEVYLELFGKRCNKKKILKRIREFKKKGFLKFYYKKVKQGTIPVYIKVTDKFLMFHKMSILMALLIKDESKFQELAVPEMERILKFLKYKYEVKK